MHNRSVKGGQKARRVTERNVVKQPKKIKCSESREEIKKENGTAKEG